MIENTIFAHKKCLSGLTLMKQLVFAFAALMVLCACQEKSRPTAAMVSDADSIYTDQYIKMHFVKEPERCLGLIDTAEMKGTMTVDSCNMMPFCYLLSSCFVCLCPCFSQFLPLWFDDFL